MTNSIARSTGGVDNERQENKWKSALDSSGDGMWEINLENNTISFSARWHEMFGYHPDDIRTPADWTAKIHPDDLLISEQSVRDHFEGKISRYSNEIRYRCSDGHYRWILSRGVLLSRKADGSPLQFIGTHKDIHKRKLAEDELRTSRETFYNSFNYSGIGKALLGLGGTWIEVNKVVCDMVEYTKDELLQFHYHEITYPDDVSIDRHYINQLLSREIPSYTMEKRWVSKTRKIIHTLLTVTLVRDALDNPAYFICDLVDITSQKKLTNQIERKKQELETTAQSLSEKIQQLERLNHMIAHNLRGPLRNIQYVSEHTDTFPPADAFKIINDSSLVLLSELDMLMQLTEIQLNKAIPYNDCNVREICEDAMKQLQGVIYQKDVNVEFALDIAEISYPRAYLASIIYNLFSNAIKYSRKDVPPHITVTTRRTGEQIFLSVKDNGIGINMDKFGSRIFNLKQVFHHGYDSKGIGLFITKTQIETLGGTIGVTSKVDEGSEFTVKF